MNFEPKCQIDEILKCEFFYGEKEEEIPKIRREIKQITSAEIQNVVHKFILEKIKIDNSSKIIFGLKDNNLEGLVSRGWRIENLFEGFHFADDFFIQSAENLQKIKKKYSLD